MESSDSSLKRYLDSYNVDNFINSNTWFLLTVFWQTENINLNMH